MKSSVKKAVVLIVSLAVFGITMPAGRAFAQNSSTQQERGYTVTIKYKAHSKASSILTATITKYAFSATEAEDKARSEFEKADSKRVIISVTAIPN
jgi:hypothetical protein